MRQRLGIGQALINQPRVLFLDEPVSSLDPEGRRDVLEIISRLRGTATVFMSTHILNDVERVCDRVAILNFGHLVVEGPIDELLDRYAQPIYELEPEPQQAGSIERLADAMRGQPWAQRGSDHAGHGPGLRQRSQGRRAGDPAAGGRQRRQPGPLRARPAEPGGRLPAPGGRERPGHRAAGRLCRSLGPRREGPAMMGFRVLLIKELREQLRTSRLVAVAAVFVLFGILGPLTDRYMKELLDAIGSQSGGMTFQVPAPSLGRRVDPDPQEPVPVRDHLRAAAGHGLRGLGEGTRHRRDDHDQAGVAGRVPGRQARRHLASTSASP